MEYIYYPKNVCSTEMKFVIENNVIKNIEINVSKMLLFKRKYIIR